MSDAAKIFGDDVNLNTPEGLKVASQYQSPTGIDEGIESKLIDVEDTLKDDQVKRENPTTIQSANREIPVRFPDYEVLKQEFDKNNKLYAVKNTSDIPLLLDWDLELLPRDMLPEFHKYLTQKYIQYQLERFIGKFSIIVVLIKGRSINFLHNFMLDKRIPTEIRIESGLEKESKSQVVILPGEQVIFEERQLKSLEKYEKVKKVTKVGEGKTTESSWLGFLILKELDKASFEKLTSEAVESGVPVRSYVNYNDVLKSEISLDQKIIDKRSQRKESGIVKAVE